MVAQRLLWLGMAALLFACVTDAQQLYKWVDEDGNVHYSDRPAEPDETVESMEQVDVDDGYGIKRVSTLAPIAAPANSPTLALTSFELRLSKAKDANVTIGRIFYGRDCGQVADLMWTEGFLDYAPSDIAPLIGQHMDEYGYRFESLGTGFSQLSLEGQIASLRIDACATSRYVNADRMTGSVYLRVNWRLLDGNDRGLFEDSSEGSMPRRRKISDAFVTALDQASRNLLADHDFHAALSGVRSRPARSNFGVSISRDVPIAMGAGDCAFVDVSPSLLAATVTVRLDRGHGSGVFISPRHVLTNAHVVQSQREVSVVTTNEVVRGTVIASHRQRDVALIEVRKPFEPVTISRNRPNPGEPLFVIGTPLDESLSHTVTKGILSAERLTNGQPFYQTDASINVGNSGGPVFDEAGELVGISVAGLFTRDGAGMNVNYVIPIDSALSKLNLAAGQGR